MRMDTATRRLSKLRTEACFSKQDKRHFPGIRRRATKNASNRAERRNSPALIAEGLQDPSMAEVLEELEWEDLEIWREYEAHYEKLFADERDRLLFGNEDYFDDDFCDLDYQSLTGDDWM